MKILKNHFFCNAHEMWYQFQKNYDRAYIYRNIFRYMVNNQQTNINEILPGA